MRNVFTDLLIIIIVSITDDLTRVMLTFTKNLDYFPIRLESGLEIIYHVKVDHEKAMVSYNNIY